MRILLFSDIHSDLTALRRLMAVEADVYFCVGDLVNWSKGWLRLNELTTQSRYGHIERSLSRCIP